MSHNSYHHGTFLVCKSYFLTRIGSNSLEIASLSVALSIFDASRKKTEAHPHLITKLILTMSVPSTGFVQPGLLPQPLCPRTIVTMHMALDSFSPTITMPCPATTKKRHLENLCTCLLQNIPTVAEAKAYLQADNTSLKVLIL